MSGNEAIAIKQNVVPMAEKVFLKVRIDAIKRVESKLFTTVSCPARDEYSKPNCYQIRSKQKFGEIGEVTQIDCQLNGFIKAFSYTNKSTGEVNEGTNGIMFLDLVE